MNSAATLDNTECFAKNDWLDTIVNKEQALESDFKTDNVSLLKSMGFFESNGWLYNASVPDEPIFKLGDPEHGPENKSLAWIMGVISATCLQAGYRWSLQDSKNLIIQEMEENLKQLKAE